jgi:hypothetical protein
MASPAHRRNHLELPSSKQMNVMNVLNNIVLNVQKPENASARRDRQVIAGPCTDHHTRATQTEPRKIQKVLLSRPLLAVLSWMFQGKVTACSAMQLPPCSARAAYYVCQ